jgi:serine protease Do
MRFSKGLATLFIIFILFLGGFGASALALSPGGHASAAVNTATNTNTTSASNIPVANSTALQTSQAAVAASPDLVAMQSTLEQIYNQVSPSVVYIDVLTSGSSSTSLQLPPGHPFFGSPAQQVPSEAQGSGFVWDTQGHIVTNNHVVSGASKITVTFSNGTTADATLVGADPNSDLAVIKVNVPADQLHPITLGDSSQVKVGQVAIAIGNPFGLSGTMTQGIISGLSRSLPVGINSGSTSQGPVYNIPDIIQTDAAINPGNSGGVLVNSDGQVIGVTAAIRSPVDANSGIGFVIPANIVQREAPVLIQTGHYDHPYLGISGTDLTYDLAKAMNLNSTQKGALVITVSPNGPAAKAGLQGSDHQVTISGQPAVVGGDVITAINGQTINSFEDLSSYLLNNTQVGQTVTLTILRQGQEKTVQLTLGALPQQLGQ